MVPAYVPKPAQSGAQLERSGAVTVGERPAYRLTVIVVVKREAAETCCLFAVPGVGYGRPRGRLRRRQERGERFIASEMVGGQSLGEPAIVGRMPALAALHLAVGGQLLPRELANRLQHSEAGLSVFSRHPVDEALVHESSQPVQDAGRLDTTAHRLSSREAPAAHEHRQPAKKRL